MAHLGVVFWSSLPSSTKKKSCPIWIPSDKTFWIRGWNVYEHEHDVCFTCCIWYSFSLSTHLRKDSISCHTNQPLKSLASCTNILMSVTDRQALKKMEENLPSRWSGLVQEVSGIIFQSEWVYSILEIFYPRTILFFLNFWIFFILLNLLKILL